MTPNHSGGSMTSARPLAISSELVGGRGARLPFGTKRGCEWNSSGKLGKHSATFESPGSGALPRDAPVTLHQSLIQTARAEQSALDQHLAALLRDGTACRDEDDLAVRVSRLAGRSLRNVDRPDPQ